jgi:hypothetical protein
MIALFYALPLAYLILEGERGASQTMGSLMSTKKMYVEETLNIWEAFPNNMGISMLFGYKLP